MPGLINPASTSSVGAVAGMKRAFAAEEAPTYGEPYSKKQKVVHKLHHTQPVQHIVEPISAELDPTGENKDFFDQQLLRAIAIQCRSVGFDGARPDVLEEFRSLVDSYMTKFLSQVRKSMSSARRTETVPHDWVYALSASGLTSSSSLEGHLDIGQIPPSMLQPRFEPPIPPQAPPPDVEGLLGAELSGRVDKENRPYIPKHFPPFPSKHTYKATPVFTQRENDPRKIREKATEEGILAEQSLRKLMAAQKQGIQRQKAGKRKRSKRMKESDRLWQESMKDLFDEEAQREAEEKKRLAGQDEEDDVEEDDVAARLRQQVAAASSNRRLNLEEGVHVNYERKFYRKSARGV